MPSNSFDFQPGKMRAALDYVMECFQWLAAGDDRLDRVVHELEIDKVIEATKTFLRNLRGARNRLAPINRLPPELLGAIFEYLTGSRSLLIVSKEHERIGSQKFQSVCRHWRLTAVNTPALWTYIRVSSFRTSERAFASTSLVRSGVLPLDVNLQDSRFADVIGRRVREGVKSNSGRIRELFVHEGQFTYINSLVQDASQLEALTITNPTDSADGFIDNWQIPKLRVFCARGFTGWHKAKFSTLRHLIVDNQVLDCETLRGLYALLSLNPRLEDLVLSRCHSTEYPERPLLALPSLDMPCLKRIHVNISRGDDEDPLVGQLIEKKLILQVGHAIVSLCLKQPPEGYFTSLQKLFLGNISRSECINIVTTDGQTSFYLKGSYEIFLRQSVHANRSRPLGVHELWLWLDMPRLVPLKYLEPEEQYKVDWVAGLQAVAGVTKLVLLHDIDAWLDFISRHDLFPSLVELQLHGQEHGHETTILHFLRERAQTNPIQTLRFVRDTEAGGKVEAFSHWKKSSIFLKSARCVVFENPRSGPLRMELPTLCTTESTVHSYWPSWESTMYAIRYRRSYV
ncbi:hypothetical protein BC835DRAFT_1423963 [Cytidiella melzeri]|nr:hypothetical protein BC835DRAFT_1423963 [Cytidiella melzeri]